MEKATPMDCESCGRRIGVAKTHYLMLDKRVLCIRCVERGDLYDDIKVMATRAYLARWRERNAS